MGSDLLAGLPPQFIKINYEPTVAAGRGKLKQTTDQGKMRRGEEAATVTHAHTVHSYGYPSLHLHQRHCDGEAS